MLYWFHICSYEYEQCPRIAKKFEGFCFMFGCFVLFYRLVGGFFFFVNAAFFPIPNHHNPRHHTFSVLCYVDFCTAYV